MEADTKCSLSAIRSQCNGLPVTQLLEIQRHKIGVEKLIEWARNLQCLNLVSSERKRRRSEDNKYSTDQMKVLRRTPMSEAESSSGYVAVSYPWEPSVWENPITGGYRILSAKGETQVPSKVWDVVLDRVVAYTSSCEIFRFWIDKECINQDDPEEKEVAMQSMDLVYSMTTHSVGLLTKPIESQADLNLLLKIQKSDFMVPPDHPEFPFLKPSISVNIALDVLDLLESITSDPWWERAWIFQEEYLSSIYMDLLIPHLPTLKKRWAWKVATLFCLAYLRKSEAEWQSGIAISEKILQKAASYKVLNRYPRQNLDGNKHRAMSSTIFTDIGNRHITNAPDILAIAANCCDYTVRLNTLSLKNTKCSLSLCILALYLLNGEIFWNDIDNGHSLSKNIFEYLKDISLDNFDPPVRDKKLAFIKNCRFVNVRFAPEGITTTGWLWRLYKEIDTTRIFSNQLADEEYTSKGLTHFERSCLLHLASQLAIDGHRDLVSSLYAYLDEDLNSEQQKERSSKYYKDLMAKELVSAITEGKKIQLACLMGEMSYRGIFIRRAPCEEFLKESFVFTAWKPRRRSSDRFGERRNEKYVSLEVELVDDTVSTLPHLKTKGWINGLYFFDGSASEDVVFPWPASLRH